MCVCSVESEAPVCKKPRTTNVVVEQAGQTDKLLIDHITDTDSVFEEVYTDIHIRDVHCMQTFFREGNSFMSYLVPLCVWSGSWAIRQECCILIKYYGMCRVLLLYCNAEGRSKQGHTNNKAKQHSTPKVVTFPKKN